MSSEEDRSVVSSFVALVKMLKSNLLDPVVFFDPVTAESAPPHKAATDAERRQ